MYQKRKKETLKRLNLYLWPIKNIDSAYMLYLNIRAKIVKLLNASIEKYFKNLIRQQFLIDDTKGQSTKKKMTNSISSKCKFFCYLKFTV